MNQFSWSWLPSVGRSGGILGGLRSSKLTQIGVSVGKFHVKMKVFDVLKQIQWHLVIVYGAAQEENKEEFLVELAEVCQDQTIPLLVGGDFNVIRCASEKNKGHSLNKWGHMFNSIINAYGLREILMSGGQFTWSNNQKNPTLEKLDRILVCKEWEKLFPLTIVHKLSREVSDHSPLILDTMEGQETGGREFRFEKSWLQCDDFLARVEKVWKKRVNGKNSLDRLQKKLKNVRNDLKGWGVHLRGEDKKEEEKVGGGVAGT